MNKFTNKHLRLIIALVLLSMMGGIGWFGVVPFYGHIREIRDEIQQFYAGREHRNEQFSRLPDIRNQFDAVRKDEGSLDILLTRGRIVDFIKVLEGLAQETDVTIAIKSEENPEVAKKKAPAKTDGTETEAKTEQVKKTLVEQLPSDQYISLKLTLTGDYASLLAFLHKLETAPFALDVTSIDIHPRNTETKTPSSSSPDRKNPFSLSPSQGDVNGDEVPGATEEVVVESEPSKKPLEAFINMVVYVDKLEKAK